MQRSDIPYGQFVHGQLSGAFLLLHGGAGTQDPDSKRLKHATETLRAIAARTFQRFAKAGGLVHSDEEALQLVAYSLAGMEDSDVFNAGLGSALQSDGQARLTSGLMSGPESRFSGVISTSYVQNPSTMALHLQKADARVITSPGSELLARQLQLPVTSNITKMRLERWAQQLQRRSTETDIVLDVDQVLKPSLESGKDCDTVGCVLALGGGRLYTGTSTGGRGGEFPGRVSDCGTVAGTYATSYAAISATGVGEEIVDDAVAARMETRCRDGMSLQEASQRCYDEAKQLQRSYGWIAADRLGSWSVAHTTPHMTYVVMDLLTGECVSQSG